MKINVKRKREILIKNISFRNLRVISYWRQIFVTFARSGNAVDLIGDGFAEDHNFQEAISTQSISTVNRRTCGLAGCPKTFDRSVLLIFSC